jgi:glycosyltransferase involved in cell wall biosynthesis
VGAERVLVRAVAYYAYGFRRAQSSGLISYVRAMRDELTARGIGVKVMTREADADDDSAFLLESRGLIRRAAGLLSRAAGGRFGGLDEQLAIAVGAFKLERAQPISLFEIEEHAGLANLLLAAPLRAPVIVRMHGPHFLVAGADAVPRDREAENLDRLERSVAQRAFALTVPSHDTLRRIRAHWQLPLPHAHVVPNATPRLPERSCWQGDMQGPILFVGRSDRIKGFDLVVRAFAKLAARFRRHELWLVGPERTLRDGGRTYTRVADFLEDALPDAALRARVKFLGTLPPEEIVQLRRKASCLLVASRFETFCLAAVEAMMAGCPLVVPDGSAPAEIVDDHESGLTFANEQVDDLARAIAELLSDAELARKLGARARSVALSRYAPESVVDRTLEIYAEVVAAAQASGPRWLKAAPLRSGASTRPGS